jgi:hypothetical protein
MCGMTSVVSSAREKDMRRESGREGLVIWKARGGRPAMGDAIWVRGDDACEATWPVDLHHAFAVLMSLDVILPGNPPPSRVGGFPTLISRLSSHQ